MRASAALFATALPAPIVERLARARAGEALDVGRLHSWRYTEYQNFRAIPTLRKRLRWLRQRILPHPAYLEDVYGGRYAGYRRYLGKGLAKLFGRS